ncbi:hypothetical protein IEQ34_010774 [Dendrobium chrysotoxum]|uniref:Uncharacterized protein n=1 Tax=Dendrobium chrysotoxum TaxID=161865 RepID=A0AAV7GTQ1_DENCH|nr:hypothetical protein IEQ34_010774 [Dendrobium chrysotoxum]
MKPKVHRNEDNPLPEQLKFPDQCTSKFTLAKLNRVATLNWQGNLILQLGERGFCSRALIIKLQFIFISMLRFFHLSGKSSLERSVEVRQGPKSFDLRSCRTYCRGTILLSKLNIRSLGCFITKEGSQPARFTRKSIIFFIFFSEVSNRRGAFLMTEEISASDHPKLPSSFNLDSMVALLIWQRETITLQNAPDP